MQEATEPPYGETVELCYRLLKAERHSIIDQPGESDSYWVAGGWRFRNVTGDLAYVQPPPGSLQSVFGIAFVLIAVLD